jgi:hypothetical protein
MPWQGVALAVGTFGFSWWLQAAPGVPGRFRATERVGAAALADDVRSVVGDGAPRVVGSPEAAAGRGRIAARLAELGLDVDRQSVRIERRAGVVELENLVARIPGSAHGADRGEASTARGVIGAIAVVAHSDSAPGSPGASDDGAGVASVLAVARALRGRPAVHDVVLLITDGEERGLLGAQAFMAQDPAAKELRAVVNLDARGASGPAFIFETGPETAWLSEQVAARVTAPRTSSLMSVVYGAMPNGTDFTVFLKAGISGFNIAFLGDMAAYHTPLDTVDRQSAQSRQHMGQTALELVRALDERMPDAGPPPGRAVYGDVLSLGVLRWPEHWTLPMALCAAPLLGACCAVGAWRALAGDERRAPGRKAALAMMAAVAVIVFAVLLGWGFGAAARAAGLTMATAPERLWALDAALFVAAIVAGAGAGLWLARRGVDPWSALCGAWSPWAAIAVGAAFAVPGAAFPFLVPLMAVALASLGAALAGASRGSQPAPAAFCGLAAAAVVFLPMEPAFMDALGFGFGWVNGLRAGLVGVTVVGLVGNFALRREAPRR